MSTIRLTAKRQATLPKPLCDEMQLQPGDLLEAQAVVVNGEKVWTLRRAKKPDLSWVGSLRKYARGKNHGLAAIRRSIEEGWADERS